VKTSLKPLSPLGDEPSKNPGRLLTGRSTPARVNVQNLERIYDKVHKDDDKRVLQEVHDDEPDRTADLYRKERGKCTCDDDCDSKCTVHWRENTLQNELLLSRELLGIARSALKRIGSGHVFETSEDAEKWARGIALDALEEIGGDWRKVKP
jgi:hypothetical protein